MEEFREQVRLGFKACKSDIESLRVENSVLRDKFYLIEQENRNLKEENKKTNLQISDLKAEIRGLIIAMDYIKDFNKTQVSIVEPQKTYVESKNEIIKSPEIMQIAIKPKLSTKQQDPYEALLAFKAKANKREILKQKIMSMIGENGINLSELKFMFVEHFRYCSKASFYNYLKELEIEKIVKVERENSKNFIYLLNIRREI